MSDLSVAWAAAASLGICSLGQAVERGDALLAAVSLAGTAVALFLTASTRKDDR